MLLSIDTSNFDTCKFEFKKGHKCVKKDGYKADTFAGGENKR